MRKREVGIMADYGDAYSWIDGANASIHHYFPDTPGLAEDEGELLQWSGWFWKSLDDRSNFPWEDFHARGIFLAQRVRELLPDDVAVTYSRPSEDPSSALAPRTILIRKLHQ